MAGSSGDARAGCAFAAISLYSKLFTAVIFAVALILSIVVTVIVGFASLFDNGKRATNVTSAASARRTAPPSAMDNKLEPSGADIDTATLLVHDLIGSVVEPSRLRNCVNEIQKRVNASSSHELAAMTALGFFKSRTFSHQLRDVQLMTRMTALEWCEAGLLQPWHLHKLEAELYRLYST